MTSLRHITKRIDAVENALLPEKQKIVVIEDDRNGAIHYDEKVYSDKNAFLKTLGDQPYDLLIVTVDGSLLVDTEDNT
ncbi:hypothetical protein KAU55_00545 [Candidatus Bathyarchaeota archaeon]|nr:hypothetical protein [Candidatus Bathyarchaeota archaeon]